MTDRSVLRTAFAALANPILVFDLTDAKAALAELRANGVADLGAHLRQAPLAGEFLVPQLRLLEANPAALRFTQSDSLGSLQAGLGALRRSPFREMLEALLLTAWEDRTHAAVELAYVDEEGRRRVCVSQLSVAMSDSAADWRTVVLSLTDLSPAGSVLPAYLDDHDMQTEIFARANLLVWRGRVRRVNGEFRWRIDRPSTQKASRLAHLLPSTKHGDLWNRERTPDLAEMTRRSTAALSSGAPGYQQEFRVIVDGRTTWLAEDVSIQQVSSDEWHLVGVVSDVTARHEAEEAYRQSVAHLRNILERADCMLWRARVTEQEGTYHWEMDVPASGLQRRIFGDCGPVHYANVTGGGGDSLFGAHQIPEAREKDARGVEALRNGASGYQNEYRLIAPNQTFWLQEQVTIHPISPGVFDLVGVTFDITERRAAEEELRQSAARMRQILERADCMLWQARVTDVEGHLRWTFDLPESGLERRLFADTAPAANMGRLTLTADNALYGGHPVLERAEIDARSERALRQGHDSYEQEFRIQTPKQLLWMHEQVSIVQVSPGVWNLVGVVTDVTGRRTAEAELAAEKERLAVTLRAMSEAVVTTDVHGHVQFMNRAATELTGCAPASAVGRSLTQVCDFSDGRTQTLYALPLHHVLIEGVMLDLPPQTNLRHATGRVRVVAGRCAPVRNASSAIIGAVLVIADVTERQRLDEHMQRTSKLESVGVLAGGIAHDFNNILTAIMGNLSLALLDLGEDSAGRQYLRDAQSGTVRARELTQQLLTFAKGGDPVRTAVSLPQVITEVTRFALHGSSVGSEFDLPPDLWSADADQGQFAQIVQNLVINAMQAMPHGGTLQIGATNDTVTLDTHLPVPPGNYVHLTVTDTGTGISAEHLRQIFDPYFTTKQHGHGLGLATVYSIVRRHSGHIEVSSTVGVGTAFHIWLPAARHSTASAPCPVCAPAGTLRGRVLFMDDEAPIRRLGSALLARLGLDVVLASDGEEAIRCFRDAHESGHPFDIVVMDLTVPGGMGGRETLAELLKIDPAVRAIVSSGYSSDPVLANFRAYGFCGMVAKPYQVEHFARVLREVMIPAGAGNN